MNIVALDQQKQLLLLQRRWPPKFQKGCKLGPEAAEKERLPPPARTLPTAMKRFILSKTNIVVKKGH